MVPADRWPRVRSVLEDILDRTPDERGTYLSRACANEPDVRFEVESLLRAHDSAGRFLESPDPGTRSSTAPVEEAETLEPGTRLGVFEIVALIGAGGMGQVYEARDTRLDRRVAIKVLSSALTPDFRRAAWVEQEARALSRLVHPHVCVLLDVGYAAVRDDCPQPFLVMEFVEGETLADRLRRGRLPLHEALRFAIEIAEALAAAHAHRIVHRDLKPGNIMLTTAGVKLLDFGLASLRDVAPAAAIAGQASGPPAAIVGTVPYMSPEQLRGEDIDGRSDLFSFGAVLFEITAGRRAFESQSTLETAAMILSGDPPPLPVVDPPVPPAIDRLVRTCLAKVPSQRWQHAHDVALQLREIAVRTTEAQPARAVRRTGLWGWAAAGALAVTAAVLAWRGGPEGTPAATTRRLMFDAAPVLAGEAWSPAASPDGRMIALLAGNEHGSDGFFIHRLEAGVTARTSQKAPESCGWGANWSADGRGLLYMAGNQLRRIDALTGGETILGEVPAALSTFRGGVSQSPDGTILTGGPRLRRLSAGDRVLREVSTGAGDDTLQIWPSFLPNGRDFLFTQSSPRAEERGVFIGSLDSDRTVRLLPEFTNAAVAPPEHLVFGRNGAILAQRLVPRTRALTGEATVLASGALSVDGYTHFTVTGDGSLVYVPGVDSAPSRLTWFDRNGRPLGTIGDPGVYRQFVISPDGRRAVVERRELRDQATGRSTLGVLDLVRGTTVPANGLQSGQTGFGGDLDPVWAPDSVRFAFTASVDEDFDLFATGLNATDPPDRLARLPGMQWAEQWSADGRFVLYSQSDSATDVSLWALPLEGRRPIALVQSPGWNEEPQLSPDGRWLAFSSNESGRFEIYLQPFGRPGERSRLTSEGGSQPKWRADGRELFFLSVDGVLMAAAVPPVGEPGAPKALFRTPLRPNPIVDQYGATPDGKRFLVLTPIHSTETARLSVISHWTGLIDRR
jgi:serine/threonine protein kinase